MGVSIIGAGALGRIVCNILNLDNKEIDGFYDDNRKGTIINEHEVLGKIDDAIKKDGLKVIIAIGDLDTRVKLYNKFESEGHKFTSAIHPSAEIGPNVRIGDGTIIKDKAVLEVGSKIGKNSIMGNGSVICHDSVINDHCRIAPGVTIAGHVNVGQKSYLGVGVSVDRKMSIGDNCIIASGCTIWKDVDSNSFVKLPQEMKTEER